MAEIDTAQLRVALHKKVWDTLNEMAIDDDLSQAEVEDVTDSMENLADLILEALQVEIVDSKDGRVTVTVIV